jgi:hypothetical protein
VHERRHDGGLGAVGESEVERQSATTRDALERWRVCVQQSAYDSEWS